MSEKLNYRATLGFLAEKYPMTISKKTAAEILGVSLTHLDKLTRNGRIKFNDGKIPLGSLASYICG